MHITALGLEIRFSGTTSKRAWRRTVVAVAAANLVVLGAGIASAAAWTSTASGAAAATASTMTFTATAGSPTCTGGSPNNCPYPSSSATGDLVLTITNSNRFTIHVTSVTLTNTPTFTGGSKGTCNTNTLAQLSVPTTAIAVPTTNVATASPSTAAASGGTQTITLVNAVTMGTTADDGCQGVGFTFPASVTAVIN
jgi:hypothetical protein